MAVAPPAPPTGALETRLTAVLTALVEALGHGCERRRALGDALTTARRHDEADRLTGLHDRHDVERFLGSASDGSVLRRCALLVGVDHPKAINDGWGHGAGGAALSAVAQVPPRDPGRRCRRPLGR